MYHRQAAAFRAEILRYLRSFFETRGYLEADVPVLSSLVIPESTIPLFTTALENENDGSNSQELYLLPSPEYYLKHLLSAGWGSLYSLGPSFRNRETPSPRHSAEFTMLEYYTLGADYVASLDLTRELLQDLPLCTDSPTAHRLHLPVRTMTMEEAFKDLAGIDLLPLVVPEDSPEGDIQALAAAQRALAQKSMEVRPDESWDDCFQRLFLTWVEPELPDDSPLALIDFPWRIRTTAARKLDTPWAQRWELYLGTLELANVYTEETDPGQTASFLEGEQAALLQQGRRVKVDPEFPKVAGALPPCSGAAMGVDRLVMAAGGYTRLDQIRYPYAK
ncbi:MAG: elongation factor P--(R)-beta-lysine ligase [Spirochaetales bacterium]|nr:elongation factor P--(R)-beta-lysine ligase [Spirochaetales bacterium]